MRSVEAAVQLFRQKGFKITPQRRAIFELLAGDPSHPTAEEIYQRVKQHMPDISRMTVYNTLHELVAVGEIDEVEHLVEGGARYDTNTASHHHLLCLRCHTLVDIDHDFDDLDLPLPEASGYQIVRRQVTFYGHCPNCQGA
jgi:Fe2+ or Zn2+ uptake regulation protein